MWAFPSSLPFLLSLPPTLFPFSFIPFSFLFSLLKCLTFRMFNLIATWKRWYYNSIFFLLKLLNCKINSPSHFFLVYILVTLSIFNGGQSPPSLVSRTILILQNYVPVKPQLRISPFPQLLATTVLLCLSMNLPILHTLYKCKHCSFCG